MVFVNVNQVIQDHDVIFHVCFFHLKKSKIIEDFILADLCAGINCNYGTCYEGRCACPEGYTGYYCETPRMKRIFVISRIFISCKS